MHSLTLVLVALALAGCGPLTPQPGSAAGNMLRTFGIGKEQAARQFAAQKAADDTKCRELGFKPGTEGYGNCRLKLEQIRATERAESEAEWARIQARRRAQSVAVQEQSMGAGHKVYDASECIGPVIMGECKGSILPSKAYHPTCHGEMLNGQCTGPMF